MNFEQFLNKNEEMKNTFKLKEINRMETWFYIKSVEPKNSQGFDCIPSKLMNLAASTLVVPMTHIINKCFKDGAFQMHSKQPKSVQLTKRKEFQDQPVFVQLVYLVPFQK